MPAKTSTPHNGAEEEGLLTSESGSRLMTLQTTEGRLPLAEVLQRNLPAAVTVAIVSISLSIALGIASGAGPQAGLSTAVWGGMAGGLFASSPYNIIGPAGALAPTTFASSIGEGAPGVSSKTTPACNALLTIALVACAQVVQLVAARLSVRRSTRLSVL